MRPSREFKARLRRKYAHLYAPAALQRLEERHVKEEKAPHKPLPRGSTLPQEKTGVPAYEHSANKPPRKMTWQETSAWLKQRGANG